MKKLMMAMVAGACLAVFGETWKDANGITWEFSGYGSTAKIMSATPAPKGALSIPATVSDGYTTYKVTEIDGATFLDNAGITSVVIPASVTKIGDRAFENCAKLASVTFKGDTPTFVPFFYEVFRDTPFLAKIVERDSNDKMADALVLLGASGERKDDNYIATIVPGEPITTVAPSPQKATKWYEWTAPKSGTVWFWTHGATFDTFLGVCTSDDTLADVAHNCDFAGGVSQVAFGVTAGTTYRIYVGGVGTKYLGSYTLKWRMGSPVTLTFDPCGGAMDMGYGGEVVYVPKNAAVSVLPTASKTYYTLAGWYTKKSGGTKVTTSTKFAKATKLYAHWAKKKFKVVAKADGAGAKKVKGSGTYAWGTKVTLSATPKSGYSFLYWVAQDTVSENAFPNYATAYRKNATAKVTVPKTSGLNYKAYFVKKANDSMTMGLTPSSATIYAEDGAGSQVMVSASSMSYPTVKTSKLPAGVKFSRVATYDFYYRLSITDPDKVPAGKNVIKITAKNRSGKKVTKSVVVWGKNKTQAIDKNALYATGGGKLVKTPCEMYVGVKHKLEDFGISSASGWKITKIGGLPSGITWNSKSQKLKGYTKKTGLYTLSFTVAKGKTKYAATVTAKVKALPAKIVGAFYGYTLGEYGFHPQSIKVTASVTKDGKVSAKVGSFSFSCNGLTYDPYSGKFGASMKTTKKTSKKNVTSTRSFGFDLDPAADYSQDALDGQYVEYTTKKTSHSITENLVAQYDIVGRRNVLSRDANGNLIFAGAEIVEDAVSVAIYSHGFSSPVKNAAGVTATINDSCDGTVKLAGTSGGKEISEWAVFWYDIGPGTMAYLKIHSFSLGTTVTYVVTLDSSGSYAESVDAPSAPAG